MKPLRHTYSSVKQSKGKTAVLPFFAATGSISWSYSADPQAPAEAEKNWYIEGFASTQDINLDQYAPLEKQPVAMQMAPSALQDLLAWSAQLPTVFRNHDLEEEVGRIVEAKIVDGKFWVKALISKSRPDIWMKIQEGVLSKFSVQFIPTVEHLEQQGGVGKPVRVIDHLVGLETSVVGLPMNPFADIEAAYAAGFLKNLDQAEATGEPMDRTQLIAQIKGCLKLLADPATATPETREQAQAFYAELKKLDAAIPDPFTTKDWMSEPPVATEAPAAEAAPVTPPATTVEIPNVGTAEVKTVDQKSQEAAAALAAAVSGAGREAPPTSAAGEAKQVEMQFSAGVTAVLGAIARGMIPVNAVNDMASLEKSLIEAGVPDKARAKAKEKLVDLFKFVADAIAVEQSAKEGDLGAVLRSFEQKLVDQSNKFQAVIDSNKALEEKLAEAQKKLQDQQALIEKQSAQFNSLTSSGPNGPGATPPPPAPVATPKIDWNDPESRKSLWTRTGEIALRVGPRA